MLVLLLMVTAAAGSGQRSAAAGGGVRVRPAGGGVHRHRSSPANKWREEHLAKKDMAKMAGRAPIQLLPPTHYFTMQRTAHLSAL